MRYLLLATLSSLLEHITEGLPHVDAHFVGFSQSEPEPACSVQVADDWRSAAGSSSLADCKNTLLQLLNDGATPAAFDALPFFLQVL